MKHIAGSALGAFYIAGLVGMAAFGFVWVASVVVVFNIKTRLGLKL